MNFNEICSQDSSIIYSHKLNTILEALNRETTLTLKDKIFKFQICLELESKIIISTKEQVIFNQIFGEFLSQNGAHSKALEHKKIALNYLTKIENSPSKFNCYLHRLIATEFSLLGLKDSAIIYLKKSIAKASKNNFYIDLASSYNNLGLIYFDELRYKEAHQNFNLSLHNFSKGDTSISNFKLSILDNIAESFLKLNRIDSSAYYYNYNLKYAENTKNEFRITQAKIGLLKIHILTKRIKEATYIIQCIDKIIQSENLNPKYSDLRLKYNWILIDYYILTKNFSKANSQSIYVSNYYQVIEKKNKENLNQILTEFVTSDMSVLKSQLSQTTQLLKLREHTDNLKDVLFFIFLSFLVCIFYLIYRNRKKTKENQLIQEKLMLKELEHIDLEKTKLALELEFKEKDLEVTALRARNEMELKGDILGKLELIEKLPTDKLRKELRLFISEFQQIQHSTEKVKLLLENIESVNIKFTDILKKRYPTLSKNELELCSLIKLSMNSKEIALLKGNTYESIKVAKNRLKKKLNLDNQHSLDEFILNF